MWTWKQLKEFLLGKSSQTDFSDSAIIAWGVEYPDDYIAPVDPHCTVIYLGNISDGKFTKDVVLDAMRAVSTDVLLAYSKVTGVEWFGPDKDIPVLRLDNAVLDAYHLRIESALAMRGIFSVSDFDEYKAHCTIPPEAVSNYPDNLLLTTPQLWWGGEKITP